MELKGLLVTILVEFQYYLEFKTKMHYLVLILNVMVHLTIFLTFLTRCKSQTAVYMYVQSAGQFCVLIPGFINWHRLKP